MNLIFSKERQEIQPMITEIDVVYGGNYFIKKNLEKYLKKAPGEEDESYKRRSQTSVFYNFLKPIIRLAAERPFSNKVSYSEDFPEDFESLKTNFDGLGNGLLFSAFEVFSLGIKHGSVGILPDYDNEAKLPFAKIIPVNDIIGIWRKINTDGTYFYQRVQFVVRSNSVEEVINSQGELQGFREVIRSKVIELIHPNIMRTYTVVSEKSEEKGTTFNVLLEEEKTLENFERIPFHLFTTEQPITSQDTIKIIPSFYDLSLLNLSHYNKQSDQDNIMTVSRYAILTITGVEPEDIDKNFKIKDKQKILGPFSLLAFANKDAKVGFAEHSGKAIAAGQQDIIKTEKAMVSLLKDYLQRQVVQETATEKNIAEKHQNLYTIYLANKLEQVFTKVFMDFGTYMGVEIKNTENLVSFSRDYSAAETAKKIDAIIKAREMGDLTSETFLSELSTLNVFSGEFDPKNEVEKIEQEAGENTKPPNNQDPNVFDEDDPDNPNNQNDD